MEKKFVRGNCTRCYKCMVREETQIKINGYKPYLFSWIRFKKLFLPEKEKKKNY